MKGEVIPGGFPPGAEADVVHTWADREPAGAGCAWYHGQGSHQ